MFDQHNVASSVTVFFSVKAIISNLTSFISENSAIFLHVFFAGTSPPQGRRFGRALKTKHTKLID